MRTKVYSFLIMVVRYPCTTWRFPEIGLPAIIHFRRMSPYTPSVWDQGVAPLMETPTCRVLCWCNAPRSCSEGIYQDSSWVDRRIKNNLPRIRAYQTKIKLFRINCVDPYSHNHIAPCLFIYVYTHMCNMYDYICTMYTYFCMPLKASIHAFLLNYLF